MAFIRTFAEKDEYIKAEYQSMENLIKIYSGNPLEYGLAHIKGDYPKTGLNN